MSEQFNERVRGIVRSIRKGHTMSYKEVAIAAGQPNAARVVARIMAHNYNAAIPCHRVIKSDGTPGGYNRGGEQKKREILLREGKRI